MRSLGQYKWEAAHVAILLGVITTLALVTHLTGAPRVAIHPSDNAAPLGSRQQSLDGARSSAHTSRSKAVHPQTSDPREVVVGPSGVGNRYVLLSTDRKRLSLTEDELTVKIRVTSLATENLVSPFASDMLEIRSPGLEPINPRTSFRLSVPAGDNQDKDVAFNIPASLSLEKATLHIHYYNYQKEIPLNLKLRAGSR